MRQGEGQSEIEGETLTESGRTSVNEGVTESE